MSIPDPGQAFPEKVMAKLQGRAAVGITRAMHRSPDARKFEQANLKPRQYNGNPSDDKGPPLQFGASGSGHEVQRTGNC